jgi:hypothetical protein
MLAVTLALPRIDNRVSGKLHSDWRIGRLFLILPRIFYARGFAAEMEPLAWLDIESPGRK